MCMTGADTMEALGLKGQYVVRVNNRKVFDGLLEGIGLSGDENSGRRLTVLRAIDKLDKFGPDGVRLLLGGGRKDESGDFTKGAMLTEEQINMVLLQLTSADGEKLPGVPDDTFIVEGNSDKPGWALRNAGLSELRAIEELVLAAGYSSDRIRIDPSVVRGLEYYTGPVYEVELTLETRDEKGRPVRFGSVGGGGRYDGLLSPLSGRARPAPGF